MRVLFALVKIPSTPRQFGPISSRLLHALPMMVLSGQKRTNGKRILTFWGKNTPNRKHFAQGLVSDLVTSRNTGQKSKKLAI